MTKAVSLSNSLMVNESMKKISVTRAVQLLQCARKGSMMDRNEFDWLTLPTAEAQSLGTVSHKLSEEVDAGLFDQISDDDLSDTVLIRWNELVDLAFEQMKSQSLFGSPAAPKRWPYFVIKQAAALDRAAFRRLKRGQGGGARRPEVEIFLESEALALFGRADKIEFLGDDVRVVDLKTAANPGGTIPVAYQYQLLLYAAMWGEMTGKFPTSIVIEWQDGSRTFRDVNQSDIDEITLRLNQVRLQTVSSNVPVGSVDEDICRYCNYRTLCPQFQVFDRDTWVRQAPFIVGTIDQIVEAHHDRSIVVRTVSSQPAHLERTVVHKFPIAGVIAIGDFVIFDQLSWRGGEGNFDVVWNTRYRNFGRKIPYEIENLLRT